MPFNIDFATMLEFSTRGTNDKAALSRRICGNLKSGNAQMILRMIYYMKQLPADHPIKTMFSDMPILVPTPRSAPLVEGGLWPTRILADYLVREGFGGSVQHWLERVRKVPKSSNFSSADQRPSCNTHYDSLRVVPAPEAFVHKIILIDDVFTLGRTSTACVRRLKETYPDAQVFVFAAMRTRGFVKTLDEVVRPSYNQMVYRPEYDSVKLPD